MKSNSYICWSENFKSNNNYSVCSLRPENIDLIRTWRNAQMSVLRQKSEITAEEQEKYFAKNIWPDYLNSNPKNILLAINFEGKMIGYGGLVHISWGDKRAEISFLVNPEIAASDILYGRCFKAFLEMIQEIAFCDLGLNRIFTETYDHRKFHISILEKLEFVKEGILKDHVCINGIIYDSIIHGKISPKGLM